MAGLIRFELAESPSLLWKLDPDSGRMQLCPAPDISFERSLFVMDGHRLQSRTLVLARGTHVLGYELKDHEGHLVESAEALVHVGRTPALYQEGYFEIPPSTPYDGTQDPLLVQDPPGQESEPEIPAIVQLPKPEQETTESMLPSQQQESSVQRSDASYREVESGVSRTEPESKPAAPVRLLWKGRPLVREQPAAVSALSDLLLEDPDDQIWRLQISDRNGKVQVSSLEEAVSPVNGMEWTITAVCKDGSRLQWKALTYSAALSVPSDTGSGFWKRWFVLDRHGGQQTFLEQKRQLAAVYAGWNDVRFVPLVLKGPLRLYLNPSIRSPRLFLDGIEYDTVWQKDPLGAEYLLLPAGAAGSLLTLKDDFRTFATFRIPDDQTLPVFGGLIGLLLLAAAAWILVRIRCLQRGLRKSAAGRKERQDASRKTVRPLY